MDQEKRQEQERMDYVVDQIQSLNRKRNKFSRKRRIINLGFAFLRASVRFLRFELPFVI